jgi:hypothetical protein
LSEDNNVITAICRFLSLLVLGGMLPAFYKISILKTGSFPWCKEQIFSKAPDGHPVWMDFNAAGCGCELYAAGSKSAVAMRSAIVTGIFRNYGL